MQSIKYYLNSGQKGKVCTKRENFLTYEKNYPS